eukprot:2976700-Heterocapsa_arctica.AAC.1
MAQRSATINQNGNQAAKPIAPALSSKGALIAVRASAAAAARTGGRLLLANRVLQNRRRNYKLKKAN